MSRNDKVQKNVRRHNTVKSQKEISRTIYESDKVMEELRGKAQARRYEIIMETKVKQIERRFLVQKIYAEIERLRMEANVIMRHTDWMLEKARDAFNSVKQWNTDLRNKFSQIFDNINQLRMDITEFLRTDERDIDNFIAAARTVKNQYTYVRVFVIADLASSR